MEYSQFLKEKFPQLHITSDVAQATPDKLMMAQMVSWAQMGGFAITFFASPLFGMLSMPVPAWAEYLSENKGVAIAGFFLGNIIVSNMVQTGAFEMHLGGELIHSKIQTGALPEISGLMGVLQQKLSATAY
mmetsp:Transcript_49181/g.100418  ORF Transcript_49181/g.100418 Transcript_49181/m.100418 type:complete len:131 (-) Transcript_49181:397-789(-)